MDTKAHRDPDPMALREMGIECLQHPQHPKTSTDGALRVILVRLGIPKVDEQAIAQVLGNVPVKALDDLRAGALVGAHDLPQVFGIEVGGEGRGAHQVTEQDRQLAPFGVRRRGWCRWSGSLSRRRHRGLERWRGRSVPRPHQTPTIIDHLGIGVEQRVFEIGEVVLVEGKLALQGAIGDPAMLVQHGDGLAEDLIERHSGSSACGVTPQDAPHAA
jgi:hypothetical protein